MNCWAISLAPVTYYFKVEIEYQRPFILPVYPFNMSKFVSLFILGECLKNIILFPVPLKMSGSHVCACRHASTTQWCSFKSILSYKDIPFPPFHFINRVSKIRTLYLSSENWVFWGWGTGSIKCIWVYGNFISRVL